jgi:hypothetical protein
MAAIAAMVAMAAMAAKAAKAAMQLWQLTNPFMPQLIFEERLEAYPKGKQLKKASILHSYGNLTVYVRLGGK